MWPAKALNLALNAQNYVYLGCFFYGNTTTIGTNKINQSVPQIIPVTFFCAKPKRKIVNFLFFFMDALEKYVQA